MDTSSPIYMYLIAAWLHQHFRHQLPSSSIVDEFNGSLALTGYMVLACEQAPKWGIGRKEKYRGMGARKKEREPVDIL